MTRRIRLPEKQPGRGSPAFFARIPRGKDALNLILPP
jgi:hypothetical protein